jgi:transposase
MSKAKKTDTDQQQFWQMVLETFKSSGLSVRQFCQQEGLSEASFYSWRKRLSNSQKSGPSKESTQADSFIQVSMPSAKSMVLELVLASGHKLHIPSDIDPAFLTGVLSAMKQAKLC